MTVAPGARHVVIGAGPAGLTAARELARQGRPVVVLEQAGIVGGLARTESYKGFHFDMGGHRFFTKVDEVQKIWHEVLGADFRRRPRLSRIYYDGRFFHYPLKPLNALAGLGLWRAVLVMLSYLRWQLFPYKEERTFEQWVTNRFGRRLFLTFFKAYTEKVWGIPCSELRAEWAAQRIKDLSLRSAVVAMFIKPGKTIKTLIEEFDYPRLGPGMMWRAAADEIRRLGGAVRLEAEVTAVRRSGWRVDSVVHAGPCGEAVVAGEQFLSSMPVTQLVLRLEPPAPDAVREAARRLTYRDFLTVCLIVDRPDPFPDNWIYVHSPEVKVGRIQNFRSWSPDMVPDPAKASLGLEYFCSEGDALWSLPDEALIRLGKDELERIGLARATEISDGCVFRVSKAYPVYDADYREHLDTVRAFVDRFENLQTIGRNGLHRYNNQDHAMLTGLLAVRNLEGGVRHDLWSVNTEPEYHEEVGVSEAEAAVLEGRITEIFPRVDGLALGAATGVVAGALLWLATLALVWKGGPVVGPTLGLLAQFLPGYSVTAAGSIIGLAYGALGGFVAGWSFAVIRNLTLLLSLSFLRRRAQRHLLKRFLELV
ncbi:MAG TPA: NAD(P)/FAD-dependent oxidoreductase [Verrucomicrobiae bacterium]|jgi:protoporphyrinogen oxidase|nr:NAD(P)/FAD-dependent oxidoreductase [Verrucomicrobiae bacterium]